MKRDFIHVDDLTPEEIHQILNLARDVKKKFLRRETFHPFANQTLAMIWQG